MLIFSRVLWLNGFLNKSCSKYDVKELLRSYSLSLDDTSISMSKQVVFAKKYDDVANRRIKQISDKNITDMFGFFQEYPKHDCVMVMERLV